jgi:hypothetical protein
MNWSMLNDEYDCEDLFMVDLLVHFNFCCLNPMVETIVHGKLNQMAPTYFSNS